MAFINPRVKARLRRYGMGIRNPRSPQQAALELKTYLSNASNPRGKKGAPAATVKAAQVDMGMGAGADGIYGPKTQAKMDTILKSVGVPTGSIPKSAPAPVVSKPSAATSIVTTSKRGPKEAAKDLQLYISNAKNSRGKKGAPASFVREAQLDMGMGTAASDGIYGPKTQARMQSLLGVAASKPVTALPPPAPASARTPSQAAQALQAYISNTKNARGKKGAPIATIKQAQKDMGMPAAQQDGIYGPKTQQRMQALLTATPPSKVPVSAPPVAASGKVAPEQIVKSMPAQSKQAAADVLQAVSTTPGLTQESLNETLTKLNESISPGIQAVTEAYQAKLDAENTATEQANEAAIKLAGTAGAPPTEAEYSAIVRAVDSAPPVPSSSAIDELRALIASDSKSATLEGQLQILDQIRQLASTVIASKRISEDVYKAYGVNLRG
jgi:hypothetical protein